MAYRRSHGKGRAKKIEPAVQTMLFGDISVAGNSTAEFYIDLSQCASLMNRRFYRQGINWGVSSIKLAATGGVGSVIVQKLPETWIMSNAWEKAFRAWQKMNKEALEEAPSTKPKFLDFKIYADAGHHEIGYDANLLPLTYTDPTTPVTAEVGEWEASKVVIPKTDGTDGVHNRELLAVGPSFPGQSPVTGYDAVSLIEGYASSRGLPDILDPNTPEDMDSADGDTPQNWMSALFNDGTTQDARVLSDMQTENNQAPYPFENGLVPGGGGATWIDTYYPGGSNQLTGLQVHDYELLTGTTIGGMTHFKGGQFPCGLIKLNFTNGSEEAQIYALQVDLVPGHHRGYLCEPMTEM